MTDKIDRPWLWAEDMNLRSRRLGIFCVFSRIADDLSPDDESAPLTDTTLHSNYIYQALDALLHGRDDEAALKAVTEYRDGIVAHHDLCPDSLKLVHSVADNCIRSLAQAFMVVRAGEEAVLSGAIDLAAIQNDTGLFQ